MFRLAYNTNGLAHHRLSEALDLLAELGYEGVAITPDVGQLDLYRLDPREVREVRAKAADLGLSLAVETGARYLLDPRKKHSPSLLDDDSAARARRVDFLRRSIDLARELSAGVVSIWSGAAPDGSTTHAPSSARIEKLWDRLAAGVDEVLAHARDVGVRLAFEPEPGMFVERTAGFTELCSRLARDSADFGLCLDVGHVLVTGELTVTRAIHDNASRLVHVHLDDIARGVHEHRMFGEGDLDLPGAVRAFMDVGYTGLAAVELSRDSHRGARAAADAMAHLRRAILHKA